MLYTNLIESTGKAVTLLVIVALRCFFSIIFKPVSFYKIIVPVSLDIEIVCRIYYYIYLLAY